jgi:hypothetical protein
MSKGSFPENYLYYRLRHDSTHLLTCRGTEHEQAPRALGPKSN